MPETRQNRTPKKGSDGNASPEKREAFAPIEHYERLIKLREESPDTFMLRTSEATRRTLFHYERQREMSGAKPEKT
jgi:hypothetical protein